VGILKVGSSGTSGRAGLTQTDLTSATPDRRSRLDSRTPVNTRTVNTRTVNTRTMNTRTMSTRARIATVGLSAIALAGLVGVGVSYADDPTESPSPSAPTSASSAQPQENRDHRKRSLVRRALHGEVTVGGKQARVIEFQRGTVEKISATSITVKSRDDFIGTYVVADDTRVRQAGEPGIISDIKAGDKVRVVAVKDGDTSTAKRIGEPKP
jgi:hypothetical protein